MPGRVTRWPALPRICLDCRTALAEGEACATGHLAIDPRRPDGAEALRAALWGDEARRRRAQQEAQRTLERPGLVRVLTAAGILAATVALVVPGPALLIAPLVASAAAAVFLFALSISRARRWLREGAEPLLLPAAGARAEPAPPPADAASYEGVVCDCEGGRARTPPFGGRPVYAYALWLWRDAQLLLREAVALELEVELDDGTRLRVLPGRCQIGPEPAPPARRPLPWALQRYVGHRMRSRRDAAYPLLPADRAATAMIAAGDRIRLEVVADPQPDPRAPAGDYRAPHRGLLVARGPAVIRIMPPQARR